MEDMGRTVADRKFDELRDKLKADNDAKLAATTEQGGQAARPQTPLPGPKTYPRQLLDIPVGATFSVVFLGDLVELKVHWLTVGKVTKSTPCFGKDCPHCPGDRIRYWYAPVLVDGKAEITLTLTETAAAPLDGMGLRGVQVKFYRPSKRSRVSVQIEEEIEEVLPEAWDVREILKKRWALPYWPDQREEEPPQEGILKFPGRKQA